MTDLTNATHNHGEVGTAPPDGQDWSGGDGLEAEYVDWIFNYQSEQTEMFIDAITQRLEDHHGDTVIDGLRCSVGSNALDIDITASTGAYINGQYTGPISAQTITTSSNNTGGMRTDAVYVDEDGQITVDQDVSTIDETRLLIGEVAVASDSQIEFIDNVAHTIVRTHRGESPPNDQKIGDQWYDDEANIYRIWNGSNWEDVITSESGTFEHVGVSENKTFSGTPNSKQGEVMRFGGSTSDLVHQVQAGPGRYAVAWNAYYDSGSDEWRSIVGGETHCLIGFNLQNPWGGGVGNSNNGGIVLAFAQENANANEIVDWYNYHIDSGGHKNFIVGKYNGRPSDPAPGQLIYRSDKD